MRVRLPNPVPRITLPTLPTLTGVRQIKAPDIGRPASIDVGRPVHIDRGRPASIDLGRPVRPQVGQPVTPAIHDAPVHTLLALRAQVK